jgi:hypothetical protein
MFVNQSILKEILMQVNQSAERFANEAVFTLQFNSAEAVRYIRRNANVDGKTAMAAFVAAVTFHKH